MAVPKNSKKVFQWGIFAVHQWEQKMFDGSVEIFEKTTRPSTAFVIPVYKNKIVICRQRQPHRRKRYYHFLWGRFEENERPISAARRELLEESGFFAKRLSLWWKYTIAHKIDWDIYVYTARDCSMVAKPHLDAGEKLELVYFNFKQFISFVVKWGIPFLAFENHILRMEREGRLGEFKQALFG